MIGGKSKRTMALGCRRTISVLFVVTALLAGSGGLTAAAPTKREKTEGGSKGKEAVAPYREDLRFRRKVDLSGRAPNGPWALHAIQRQLGVSVTASSNYILTRLIPQRLRDQPAAEIMAWLEEQQGGKWRRFGDTYILTIDPRLAKLGSLNTDQQKLLAKETLDRLVSSLGRRQWKLLGRVGQLNSVSMSPSQRQLLQDLGFLAALTSGVAGGPSIFKKGISIRLLPTSEGALGIGIWLPRWNSSGKERYGPWLVRSLERAQ